VKEAGVACDARADAGETLADAHERVTVTLLAAFGTKFLLTVNVAWLSVLTMAQEPALRAAEHVPLDE
jgi:hypothetical protein